MAQTNIYKAYTETSSGKFIEIPYISIISVSRQLEGESTRQAKVKEWGSTLSSIVSLHQDNKGWYFDHTSQRVYIKGGDLELLV